MEENQRWKKSPHRQNGAERHGTRISERDRGPANGMRGGARRETVVPGECRWQRHSRGNDVVEERDDPHKRPHSITRPLARRLNSRLTNIFIALSLTMENTERTL